MKRQTVLSYLFLMSATLCVAAEENKNLQSLGSDERMKRIFSQGQILSQGIDYSRKFEFDLAFQKMREATEPQYLNDENDKSYPLMRIVDLYRELGMCEEALATLDWHLKQLKHPRSQEALNEKKAYLGACAKYQKTRDKQPIYQFIDEYKTKYKARIPPKAKAIDVTVFATLVELYDLIGDYDVALDLARKNKKKMTMNSTKQDYDELIQALEESKRGMPKECSSDGKYCVGRATAYIIRSKYF